MSQPTKRKHSEQLATQENVENNLKENSTLVENEDLKGTPFILRKRDNQWFLTVSDYRVTEPTNTKEEQLFKLDSEKWLLIMHICIITMKKLSDEEGYEKWKKKQEELDTEQSRKIYEDEQLGKD